MTYANKCHQLHQLIYQAGRNHECNFLEVLICQPHISQELLVQISWNLVMFIPYIWGTTGLIFMKFGIINPEYLRNHWSKFHENLIYWPWISHELLVQISWNLVILTLSISRTTGPNFMKFCLIDLEYLMNHWSKFHEIWNYKPWIFEEPLVQVSWNFDILTLNISWTTGPNFMKFGYFDLEYLKNHWSNFHEIWIYWPWISHEPMVQISWNFVR